MNDIDKKKIYALLSAPLPEEAVQRTDGAVTGRGYSTTGYGYQYVANRLNEVLGIGGWRTQQAFTVRTSTSAKGRTVYDVTCELVLQLGSWMDGQFLPFCEVHGTGGHSSTIEADARKGSYTNAFKKAAGMAGVGKAAFEGTIDDDNVPIADAAVDPREAEHGDEDIPASGVPRNRLTSKQLAALWALARKLGIEKGAFRNRVRERYGANVEFLTRADASALIGELSARLGNGHVQRREHAEEVA